MSSLIKEKFKLDRFERRKQTFFKRYGWKFMPFAQKDPLPDARLLVPHQMEEVQKLIDLVHEGDLVSFIVSDIGMGKTALCKFLVEALPAESQKMVSVFLPGSSIQSAEQLIRLILMRLELKPNEGDLSAEFEQFYRWHETYPDLSLALIIDEFPDMSDEAIEIVRALVDLRGVNLILNGQKNELLNFVHKHSPSLFQRKRFLLELKPMGVEEIEELLALRMAWARGNGFENLDIEPFTKQVVLKIQKLSKGIPREALKLAGDAVYSAIEQGSLKITPQFLSKPVKTRKRKKVKPKKGVLKFLRFHR